MSKKKIIIYSIAFVLVVGLIIVCKNNYERNQFEEAEEKFLEYFYENEKLVSKGNLFDMRYIHYNSGDASQSAIEIIKKEEISIFDVENVFVEVESAVYPVIFSTRWSPKPYKYNQLFEDDDVYHPRFQFIKLLDKHSFSDEIIGKDSSNITFIIEHKGITETHNLEFNLQDANKTLYEVLNDYVNGEIELNLYTRFWISAYYVEYKFQVEEMKVEDKGDLLKNQKLIELEQAIDDFMQNEFMK